MLIYVDIGVGDRICDMICSCISWSIHVFDSLFIHTLIHGGSFFRPLFMHGYSTYIHIYIYVYYHILLHYLHVQGSIIIYIHTYLNRQQGRRSNLDQKGLVTQSIEPTQKKVLKQTANIQTCCCLIHALDSLQKKMKKHEDRCCALIAPFLAALERHYIAHVGSILVLALRQSWHFWMMLSLFWALKLRCSI